MSSKKPRLVRIVLWWLRNYFEIRDTWIRGNWCLAITIFIIGALDGWGLDTAAFAIFTVGLVLNMGLYFCLRAINTYLKDIPEGPDKEEIHDEMTKLIKGRIERGC